MLIAAHTSAGGGTRWWEVAATLATGLGVLVAIGVPLWREYIRPRQRRPVLTLAFGDYAPTPTVRVDILSGDRVLGPDHLYVRLQVTNESGRDTAETVRVYIDDYRPPQPQLVAGEPERTHEVEPLRLPLIWTHSAPTTTSIDIPAGYPLLVDFVAVNAEDLDVLTLQVLPIPLSDLGQLFTFDHEPQVWTLSATVVARNAPASRWTIELSYAGTWAGGESLDGAPTVRVQPFVPTSE